MTQVNHERLLLQTADVLELLLKPDNGTTVRGKQKLVQTVNEFNRELLSAKENASTLPGGELLIEEQDEIIGMLEELKERKKRILRKFSSEIADQHAVNDTKMEVDSTASTPAS